MEILKNQLEYYNIKNFTVEEIAMGREIAEHLLMNIIPTLRVLQELRSFYEKPITILSVYRSPEYNKAVKGSKNSLHLSFNAIDFTIADKEDLMKLLRQLYIWDNEYYFQFLNKKQAMGLGYYEKRFIHLDTRGVLGKKCPARWFEY